MSQKRIDPMKCEKYNDMAKCLEQNGFQYDHTTGGHGIFKAAHGTIVVPTHKTLDKHMRHTIWKEALKILAIGVVLLCVLIGWGVL